MRRTEETDAGFLRLGLSTMNPVIVEDWCEYFWGSRMVGSVMSALTVEGWKISISSNQVVWFETADYLVKEAPSGDDTLTQTILRGALKAKQLEMKHEAAAEERRREAEAAENQRQADRVILDDAIEVLERRQPLAFLIALVKQIRKELE